MLPFVNKAFGLSSFIGVLYFAAYYNQTEGPADGGVAHPGEGVGVQEVPLDVPPGEVNNVEPEQPVETLFIQAAEEMPKPFVAPLELLVMDETNIESIKQGSWILIGYICGDKPRSYPLLRHLDCCRGSQRFLRQFMGFFENLAAQYNSDDIKLNFGIINIASFPSLSYVLRIDQVPSILFMVDGALTKSALLQSPRDWKVLRRIIRKGWLTGKETPARKIVKPKKASWFRLTEYKLTIKFVQFTVRQ